MNFLSWDSQFICVRGPQIDHKYYLAGYIIQGAFAILLLKNPEIILKEKERG